MIFNDFKAYRQAMEPILRQRKLLRGNEPEIDNPPLHRWHNVGAWALYITLTIAIIYLLTSCDHAFAYTDQQAIKTIVGEASNQGEIGMIAVAEVIRHNRSLHGFYGLKASHSAHEPKWVWDMARNAWSASKTSNLTHGANHFENIHAFGAPYWVSQCVKTFSYRDHVFYREVSNG